MDTTLEYWFESLSNAHRKPVVDIFNYYIENSFAAYFETKVGYEFFDGLMSITEGYPRVAAMSSTGQLVGFAFLRPYSPIPTLRRTAEISYFIEPLHTGKGIGGSLLEYLIHEAKNISINSILASISSLNQPSVDFHLKNGFILCGTLSKVGRKHDKDFDIIQMQRVL